MRYHAYISSESYGRTTKVYGPGGELWGSAQPTEGGWWCCGPKGTHTPNVYATRSTVVEVIITAHARQIAMGLTP